MQSVTPNVRSTPRLKTGNSEFEGIDSERGIAWRLAESFSLRAFVGYAPYELTADHSTLSWTRRLIVSRALKAGKKRALDRATAPAMDRAIRHIW
jgi:hypothetical protein